MQIILIGIMVGVIGANEGIAPRQPDAVASQILDRIENIQKLREKYRAALDLYQDERKKLTVEISKLRKTSENLDAEAHGLEVAVRSQHDDILKYQVSSGESAEDILKICDAVIVRLSKTRRNIQSGIPFNVAGRLNELFDAENKIKSVDVDQQADGIKHYFIFHRQEFHLAQSTEILNDVVDISEKRQLPGHLFRFGLVGQWFVTENQSWVGRFNGNNPNGYEQIYDVKESDRVLEVFSIMRRRRMPGLVSLVLPLNSSFDAN